MTPVSPPTTPTTSQWATVAIPILILAGLCAYANSMTKVFVFDDDYWITNNGRLVSDPVGAMTMMGSRDVAMATIVLNHQFGGFKPFGYHVVNVAVHLLATLALYGFVRRTLELPHWEGRYASWAAPLALTVTLFWSLHPLQTQSVTYIIQRCESMMGMFFLIGFYAVVRSATDARAGWWRALAVAAFVVGSGCKETMVVFPPLVAIYDRVFVRGSWREVIRSHPGFYLVLGLVWIAMLSLTVLGAFYGAGEEKPRGRQEMDVGFGIQSITPYQYFLTQAGVIVHYIRLAIWPSNLCFDYQGWPIARSPLDVVWQLPLMVALLGVTLWASVRRPALGFVGLWFFATLAPTSSIMPIIDVAFEHRMYLPLLALVVLVVMTVASLLERLASQAQNPRIVWLSASLLVGLVSLALGLRTFARNEVYRSPIAIWADVSQKNPRSSRAFGNLSQALLMAGRFDDAVKAADEAIVRQPNERTSYVYRGSALVNLGRLDEGQMAFEKALEVAKGVPVPNADNNLAWCHIWAGRWDLAEKHFRRAVEAEPNRGEYRYNLALTLFHAKRDDEARTEVEAAKRSNPGWAANRARINRMLSLMDEVKPHERQTAYLYQSMIVRIDEHRSIAHLDTLAFLAASLQQYPEAASITREAIQLAESTKEPGWVAILKPRLAAYEAGRPVRPTPTSPKKS